MQNLFKINQPNCSANGLLLGVIFTILSSASLAGTVSQSPLFLTQNVKPNILLMLDNSGSMNELVLNSAVGKAYDSSKAYPIGASCSALALPVNNEPYGDGVNCTNAGGSRSGPRGARVCSITYGTAIPNSFYGNTAGGFTGIQCFNPTQTYNTSLSIPAGVTTNAQKANWLNWYYSDQLAIISASSTRLDIVKRSAISVVDSLKDDVRVGFATFNTNDEGKNGGMLHEVVDDLTTTKKDNIKKRIGLTGSNTWTPLSETLADVGNYFATGSDSNVTLKKGIAGEASQAKSSVLPSALFNNTTWSGRTSISGEPGFSTSPIQLRCQKCFTLFLTDGLPTQDREISANKFLRDYDGDCTKADGTLNTAKCLGTSNDPASSGYQYDMKIGVPYPNGSESSDYFDDVSKALFEMDMRPDLRLPTKESPNAKNNLTTYVVGFADSAIDPTQPGVNPLPKDAAEGGGGKFLFAGNEGELTATLLRTFQTISEATASASSVAANSSQFSTDSLVFQAIFNSADWSGDVKTFGLISEVDADNDGVVDPAEDTNGNGVFDLGLVGGEVYRVSTRLPQHTERDIYTYDAELGKGIQFFWDKLNPIQKQILDNANAAKNGPNDSPVLNFLRGDKSRENSATDPSYRVRSTVLGDIINSDPLYVGNQDFGYSSLPSGEGSSYAAYVADKKDNTEMLYVGANDGMLHAFQVELNPKTGLPGTELFAYVPNTVISSELATLPRKDYIHHFFVDGSAQFNDVYYDSNWHTILIGSMGAGSTTEAASSTHGLAGGVGGRGLFALDISRPDNFSENSILWEFTSRQNIDLGYTIPSPAIVRLAGGRWVAVFGNGFNSANGKAALFIVDIKTGALLTKDAAGNPAPIVAENLGNNGLSTPVPVDVDSDKVIDFIYAGDLKGNLWKFDVTGSSPADWKVANTGNPLFIATDKDNVIQTITSKLAIAKASGTDQASGVMIYFGTGKYYEVGDHTVPTLPQTQTFYGIWDKCDKTITTGCTVNGRGDLVKQTITQEVDIDKDPLNVPDVRITTQCQVAYGTTAPPAQAGCDTTANRKGWYMDLLKPGATIGDGERVIFTPILSGNAVIFPTFIPINETCQPGADGWLMEVDINGARLNGAPLDFNNDGKIDDTDIAGSGMRFDNGQSGGLNEPIIIDLGNGNTRKIVSTTSEKIKDPLECNNPPCEGKIGGARKSWRQLR